MQACVAKRALSCSKVFFFLLICLFVQLRYMLHGCQAEQAADCLQIIDHCYSLLQVHFEGEKWENISEEAIDLVRQLLDRDYSTRISAAGALQHPWILAQCGTEGCVFEDNAVEMLPLLSQR